MKETTPKTLGLMGGKYYRKQGGKLAENRRSGGLL
jgi:hypothetical protein